MFIFFLKFCIFSVNWGKRGRSNRKIYIMHPFFSSPIDFLPLGKKTKPFPSPFPRDGNQAFPFPFPSYKLDFLPRQLDIISQVGEYLVNFIHPWKDMKREEKEDNEKKKIEINKSNEKKCNQKWKRKIFIHTPLLRPDQMDTGSAEGTGDKSCRPCVHNSGRQELVPQSKSEFKSGSEKWSGYLVKKKTKNIRILYYF